MAVSRGTEQTMPVIEGDARIAHRMRCTIHVFARDGSKEKGVRYLRQSCIQADMSSKLHRRFDFPAVGPGRSLILHGSVVGVVDVFVLPIDEKQVGTGRELLNMVGGPQHVKVCGRNLRSIGIDSGSASVLAGDSASKVEVQGQRNTIGWRVGEIEFGLQALCPVRRSCGGGSIPEPKSKSIGPEPRIQVQM